MQQHVSFGEREGGGGGGSDFTREFNIFRPKLRAQILLRRYSGKPAKYAAQERLGGWSSRVNTDDDGSPSRDFDTSGPAGGAVGARADGRAPEHEVRWRVGYKLGVASALIL